MDVTSRHTVSAIRSVLQRRMVGRFMNEMKRDMEQRARKSIEPLSRHLPGRTEEYHASISPDS